MLKTLKQGVLGGASRAGVLRHVAGTGWRGRRLLVLCYHGIALGDEAEWDPRLYMKPALLRERLKSLADGGYAVLPLDDAVERLYAGTLPPRAVALTFDDGAHDFHEGALPLLEEFGFPATVYLTTYYVDHGGPVFDVALSYLLWKSRGRRLQAPEWGRACADLDLDSATDAARVARVLRWRTLRAGLDADDKLELLKELAGRLDFDWAEFRSSRMLHLMTPEQVADCVEKGVTMELHTHRHRTPADAELFKRELADNARRIETLTGRRPRHFCYPSGIVRPEFVPWLRDAGIRSATTTRPGMCSPRTEPLLMPRVVDHQGLSDVEIEAWLTGTASWIPRRHLPYY